MSVSVVAPLEILDHNFARIFPVPTEVADVLSYVSKFYNRRSNKMKITQESVIDENGIFLAGLVFHLQKELPHYQFAITDHRVFPPLQFNVPELRDPKTGAPLAWRPYQIDYLVRAIKAGRMIFDSETGSGKTVMIASVIDCLRRPTLIIAPNLSVLGQLQEELGHMLPHVRFGTTADKNPEEYEFLIGLSRSLSKWPTQLLQKFQVVLVDEAHTAAASQTHDVMLATNAPYRFGFTADSKGRSDGRDLIVWGLLGEPVRLIDRKELEEQGYSPSIVVDMHRGWFEGEFHHLEDLLIVNNPKRNQLIYDIVQMHKNCTILILVSRTDHGDLLQKMIPDSVFVWGQTDKDERSLVRQQMKDGRLKVLIASRVFAMGMDIPNIEVGINAAGGKASILTGQRLGRVMRTWNDIVKKWVDIYDDYHIKLADHSKERLAVYKRKQTRINYIGFPPGLQSRLEEDVADEPDPTTPDFGDTE